MSQPNTGNAQAEQNELATTGGTNIRQHADDHARAIIKNVDFEYIAHFDIFVALAFQGFLDWAKLGNASSPENAMRYIGFALHKFEQCGGEINWYPAV